MLAVLARVQLLNHAFVHVQLVSSSVPGSLVGYRPRIAEFPKQVHKNHSYLVKQHWQCVANNRGSLALPLATFRASTV